MSFGTFAPNSPSTRTSIQLRNDTAANWTLANPTLGPGEIGVETDTLKIKVGNGNTTWTSLPYLGLSSTLGTATLVGGTATVANTAVVSRSLIFLTCQVPSGVAGALYVTSKTAGVGFSVASTSTTDTSTFAYQIFESA